VIPYLATIVGLPRTLVLSSVTMAALVFIVTVGPCRTPEAVRHRDTDKRPCRLPAAVGMLQTGDPALAVAASNVVAIGILWTPVYGPEVVLFCELFDTRAAGRLERQSAVVSGDLLAARQHRRRRGICSSSSSSTARIGANQSHLRAAVELKRRQPRDGWRPGVPDRRDGVFRRANQPTISAN